MPFISLTTNRKLTLQQEVTIKEELGKLISIIPNKSEDVLMLHFEDNQIMYYQGKDSSCMMMAISLYNTAPLEAKQKFVQEVTKMIEEVANISIANQYLSFQEFPNWGKNGELL
ncbi:MAG: tautomerase family protein [Coprobacillaceae bacterium]